MGNSRFSDGFLFGLIIGGAAVFLLGTEKGNKILKAIADEGFEGITDLIDDKLSSQTVKKSTPKPEENIEEKIELEPVSNETNGHSSASPAKRFFKRNK